MMRFVGIWYNATRELKRDYVNAANAEDASAKLYAMYPDGKTPGPCLTVAPASGSYGDGGVANHVR